MLMAGYNTYCCVKVSGRAKRETLHTVYQQTVQLEVRAVLKAGLRVINDGE